MKKEIFFFFLKKKTIFFERKVSLRKSQTHAYTGPMGSSVYKNRKKNGKFSVFLCRFWSIKNEDSPTLPYPALRYPTLPYRTLSYLIVPYHIVSCPTVPYLTLSYLTISYPILTYLAETYPTHLFR